MCFLCTCTHVIGCWIANLSWLSCMRTMAKCVAVGYCDAAPRIAHSGIRSCFYFSFFLVLLFCLAGDHGHLFPPMCHLYLPNTSGNNNLMTIVGKTAKKGLHDNSLKEERSRWVGRRLAFTQEV